MRVGLATNLFLRGGLTKSRLNSQIKVLKSASQAPSILVTLRLPLEVAGHQDPDPRDETDERSVPVSYTHLTLPTIYSV